MTAMQWQKIIRPDPLYYLWVTVNQHRYMASVLFDLDGDPSEPWIMNVWWDEDDMRFSTLEDAQREAEKRVKQELGL